MTEVRATEGVGSSQAREGLDAKVRGSEVTGSHERILSGEWEEMAKGDALVTAWRRCCSRNGSPAPQESRWEAMETPGGQHPHFGL